MAAKKINVGRCLWHLIEQEKECKAEIATVLFLAREGMCPDWRNRLKALRERRHHLRVAIYFMVHNRNRL